jgi:excisionase family DNA binding protein
MRQKAVLSETMNNKSEIKRLADAVACIASTITEIIDTRLKTAKELANAGDAAPWQRTHLPTAIEGWVEKRDVAKHLKISVSTVNNWMRKGLLPCIRIGRSVRFKLSEGDEALSRRNKVQKEW